MDADALSRAIHARQVSCREVMQAYLAQIERFNPQVNALVSLRPAEELLAEADACDRQLAQGQSRGWMHGMPQAIKDLAATAGLRTTMGSPLFAEQIPHTTPSAWRASRRRRDHHRQDQRPRIRPRLADLQQRVRHHRQRLRSDVGCRGQQRRGGGGAGVAHAARGRRQRHDGFAAQPGGVQQRIRLSPVTRPRALRSGAGSVRPATGHRRADGPHRHRCRPVAWHPGGLRPARTVVVTQSPEIFHDTLVQDFSECASAGWATTTATCRWRTA